LADAIEGLSISFEDTALLPRECDDKKDAQFYKEMLEPFESATALFGQTESETAGNMHQIAFNVDKAAVKKLSSECEVTKNTIIMTALANTLSRLSLQNDVLISLDFNTRRVLGAQKAYGMYVNTLPLKISLKKGMTLGEAALQTMNATRSVVSHPNWSLSEMLKDFGFTPQINYTFRAGMNRGTRLSLLPIIPENVNSQFPLAVTVDDVDDLSYFITVEYDENAINKDTAKLFAVSLEKCIINLLAAGKDDCIENILITDSEDEHFQNAVNNNAAFYPKGKTVVDLIADTAERLKDKDCLIYKELHMKYGEFAEITDKTAAVLKTEFGIGREDKVCLLLGRSENTVLAPVSVMKAGGAYVPIDPGYPDERIKFIISDSEPKLIIADEEYLERLGGIIGTDKNGNALPLVSSKMLFEKAFEGAFQITRPAPQDLAYIIYTSGTTGNPKGVMIEHEGLVNLVTQLKGYSGIDEGDGILFLANYVFDASIEDIFTALTGGFRLIISPKDAWMEPDSFYAMCERERAAYVDTTPSLLESFDFSRLPFMKTVNSGGEAMSEALYQKLKASGVKIINSYGPTEVTISSMINLNAEKNTIGKPLGNLTAYVLDTFGKRQPRGAAGELFLGGIGVARGYLNRPKLSAEKFIKNPFGEGLIYATGDLVSFDSDGDAVYLGRNDFQVKIRGYRVEIGEIEKRLREIDGVLRVVVSAFDDTTNHSKLLAAYFSAEKNEFGESVVTADILRERLSTELPYYMIPSAFIEVESFPVTLSGKIDIRALPKPVPQIFDKKILPENETEKLVYETAVELLNSDEFGVTADLFTVGLHSLLSVTLAVKLTEKLHKNISATHIMSARTVRAIAEKIGNENTDINTASHMPIQDYYPLRKNQLGIYMGWQNNPDALLYNIPSVIHYETGTDPERLSDAVEAAIDRNPILKTNAIYKNGEIVLVRNDNRKIRPETVSLGDKKCKEFVRPFDIEEDELIRVLICKGNENAGPSLYIDVHHIVFDGLSSAVLIKQIGEIYNGAEKENLTPQFDAFDDMLFMSGDEGRKITERAEKYFDKMLDGVNEPPILPSETITEELGIAKRIEKTIGKSAIKKLSNNQNAYFQKSLCEALCKLSGLDKTVITMTSSGRNDIKTAGLIGMFVSTIPFVYEKGMSESDVETRIFECLANDSYSLFEMSAKYKWTPRVTYVNRSGIDTDSEETAPHYTEEFLIDDSFEAKFPLTVSVDDAGENFLIGIEYSENALSKEAAKMIMKTMLGDTNSSELSILKGESINLPYESIVDSFKKAAANFPGKKAVVYGNNSEHYLTYKMLDEKSDALASHLCELGVGRGDAVGIMLCRDEPFPVAALGVLKTGACYMPLDPGYPDERLEYMAGKSNAKCIIVSPSQKGRLPAFSGIKLGIDEVMNLPVKAFPRVLTESSDTFILLFTSGTTGMPKGVMLTNENLCYSIRAEKKMYGVTDSDNIAGYASFGFDAGMLDLYLALSNGGTLYIIPETDRLDLEAIAEFYKRNEITFGFITTQLGRQFAIKYPKIGKLRVLAVGGEALVPMPLPEYTVVNIYGPTECTIAATGLSLEKEYEKIPIGLPLSDYRIYIVDENLNAVPKGEEGELCIGGPCVGKGYINDPERTEKVFVHDPFSPEFPVMYRTGDIARIAVSGENEGYIVFEGRRDNQVKIRGYRIELTEIEARIRDYSGVADATVQALPAPAGGLRIVAYIVEKSNGAVDISELNNFIEEKLPPYTVPSASVKIDKIPLNRNGKVDRNALPDPGTESAIDNFEAPRSEFENILLGTVKKILGTENIGVTSDLIAAGMSSLSGITIAMEASEKTGVKIKAMQLMKLKTIRAVSEKFDLGAAGNINKTVQFDTNESENEKTPTTFHKLTPEQLGIYFDTLKAPDSTIYNIPSLFEFAEGIDADRLAGAVYETISAHPFLGTYVVSDKGAPSFAEPPILPILPQVERVTKTELEEIKNSFVRPFGIFTPPLYRIRIAVCEGKTYLFTDFHHIIFDGSSMAIIFSQISDVYSGGHAKSEKYSGYSLCDIAAGKQRSEAAREYYKNMLDIAGATEIRPDKQNNTDEKSDSGIVKTSLSKEITDSLGKNIKSGLSSAFLGAFVLCLRKFEGENNIRIAIEYSGRDSEDNIDSVSMLVKTLPFGVSISGSDTLDEIAEKCADAMFETIENSSFPLVSVNSEFGFSPLIAFNYLGEIRGEMTLGNTPGKEIPIGEKAAAKMAFGVTISHTKDALSKIIIEFDQNKYSEDSVNRFRESFIALLENFAKNPDSQAKNIAALSDSQLKTIKSFIRNDERLDDALSIPEVFAKQVKSHPEKIAVIGKDRSYTYRELSEVTDKIANFITSKGAKPGSPVAFILRRTSKIPAAELGIIKSGCCFIPIDPDYPTHRILYVLKDSAAPFVIVDKTDEKTADLLKKIASENVIFDINTIMSEGAVGAPENKANGNSPAYIIYTSGTTGLPKGVKLRHKGLLNFVSPTKQNRQFQDFTTADGKLLACYTVSFDPSVKDIFGMLLNGLTVVIATEEECRNPNEYAAALLRNGCNIIGSTPSVITALLAADSVQSALAHMKYIFVGGEKFPKSLGILLRKAAPNAQIINSYGPTETTIECNTKYLTLNEPEITIGQSVNATPEFIADIDGQPLPAGSVGELYIGGDQVALGYLNRPELTAEKFITLSNETAEKFGFLDNDRRFYKSGDLARMNADGEPIILGRNDNQVKFHGLRIELGEIEKAIESYSGINKAYAEIRPCGVTEQICAYFTADREIDLSALREHIAKTLAAYMIPAAYKQLDEMPRTPNGKVDTKALPEPVLSVVTKFVAPVTPAQKSFCDIYKKVLSRESDVGIDDDFFAIGGTSLLATQVTIEAGDQGMNITYADVFAHPTPRELSKLTANLTEKNIGVSSSEKADINSEKDEIKDYDYEKINEFLEQNNESSLMSMTRRPLGNICLTGSTGYLGAHILYSFIKEFYGVAFVPVRANTKEQAERRLKAVLVYYFEDDFAGLFGSRIVVIPGDITQTSLYKQMERLPIDTYINSAANVKHFSAGTDIEDVNIGGMKLGLEFAKKVGASFVQISTTSTCGLSIGGTPDPRTVFTENKLYFGQELSNKYICSKFIAERNVLKAAADGIAAKVIRVGNLMARDTDGIFQANFNTNGFMKDFKAYRYIGKIPYNVMNNSVEFAPIGEVAYGVLLLASTPRENCVFHLFNNHNVTMGDFIRAMNTAGYNITPCEQDEFDAALSDTLHNRKRSEVAAGLMAYSGGERDFETAVFAVSCGLTLDALARKGFYWPITDKGYFERLIDHLGSLGYFDLPGEV
jgi:amino acid adenylation domain-containing protein